MERPSQPYVTVTVTGPGGSINDTFLRIQRALVNEQIPVTVENEYPVKEEKVEVYLKRCNDYGSPLPVVLVAEHLPWGG